MMDEAVPEVNYTNKQLLEWAGRDNYVTQKGIPIENPTTLEGKDLSLAELRGLDPETVISAKYTALRRGGVARRNLKVKQIVLPVPEAKPPAVEGVAPPIKEIPRQLSLEQVSELETRFPIELLWTDEKDYLDRLTTEIEAEGLTEPVTIRVRSDGSLIVWDGIHRLAVAQKLGIKNIPVKFIGEIDKLPETMVTPKTPAVKAEVLPMSIVEYDRQYSLEELREMARQAGLSASGSKKEIAARLIAKGVK